MSSTREVFSICVIYILLTTIILFAICYYLNLIGVLFYYLTIGGAGLLLIVLFGCLIFISVCVVGIVLFKISVRIHVCLMWFLRKAGILTIPPVPVPDETVEVKRPILVELIARGSYGEVYKGTFEERMVAIKTILSDSIKKSLNYEESMKGFNKEAEILKNTSHPNIIKLYVKYECKDTNRIMLVMELMEQDLWDYLKNSRETLSLQKQVDISLQISNGLRYLHQLNPPILHRDLHPGNVLLNKKGTVFKITDFGMAKFRPDREAYETEGTPGHHLFMPPESFSYHTSVLFSRKSDVFSLGVLMLQVTIGIAKPSCGFQGIGTTPEVVRREKDIQKIPFDHPLRNVILHCLKDPPSDRPDVEQVYQTMNQVKCIYYETVTIDMHSEFVKSLVI